MFWKVLDELFPILGMDLALLQLKIEKDQVAMLQKVNLIYYVNSLLSLLLKIEQHGLNARNMLCKLKCHDTISKAPPCALKWHQAPHQRTDVELRPVSQQTLELVRSVRI